MLSEVDELPSVQLGDYTLRFELEDLTPFGKEVATNELRETPEIKAKAIEELREMLKGMCNVSMEVTKKFILQIPVDFCNAHICYFLN